MLCPACGASRPALQGKISRIAIPDTAPHIPQAGIAYHPRGGQAGGVSNPRVSCLMDTESWSFSLPTFCWVLSKLTAVSFAGALMGVRAGSEGESQKTTCPPCVSGGGNSVFCSSEPAR